MSAAQAREFRVHALQPQWEIAVYRSAETFQKWMRSQLMLAQTNFDPERPNLVVLTELNGLPLAIRGSVLAQKAPSLQLALAASLIKHLPESAYFALSKKVNIVQGLMLALAPENMQLYLRTCAELAREHQVYLLCGSSVHPRLTEQNGTIRMGAPELYNQAVLLSPEGKVLGTWDKVHLTADEYPLGMVDAPLKDLVTVPTPVGDIGVATSLDAFRPDVIEQLERTGTTVFLQPDANATEWTGTEHGTSTTRPQPEAWLDSSWAVVQNSRTIQYAVNPMVVGNLFDVSFDGQSAIIGKADQAANQQSYIMTEPRAGFLALMPWVKEGTPEELRTLGEKLKAGSKDPQENQYRSGAIFADLTLPASTVPPHPLRPYEQALQAVIDGKDIHNPARALGFFWWIVGGLLLMSLFSRAKKGTKVVLGLLGLLLVGLGF
ncbi:nitrilase-related carbon-nitrogen hydrolase [Deinococcus cellulosilyticus]|uniref:Carbon-nitrogen hydrolase family protein n=1 Tax=Deinococcus cellulosilyticus (strain DSM 18568 / NBRC 106333 / KACC 11606 / 5516J-15) TaxID=1223518 RepID=A0A511N4Q5_DEIC1|nr:nitrilase-related carbon-nitrogen hydrolase [Deinococcus cellulosilyticus]GEM47822.1 carbon-nitrogen hydrolase family protein [Deinococcus cellulosilyticus NBRC 106333 = KACC 11606]